MKKHLVKGVFGIAVALFFCLSSVLSAFAVNGTNCINWYCIREKNHMQPQLDSTLSIINDYQCLYIDKNHSTYEDDLVVYLTFDVGYENGNVSRILDTMNDNEVQGAFFVLGNLLNKNPTLIKRMLDEGHLVCNHTYSHRDMTKCEGIADFKEELDRLSEAFRKLTGRDISKFYRPPEGKFNAKGLEYAQELGYTTVFWSFAYADWDNAKQPSSEKAFRIIMDNIHNGAILLLHPTSSTNADILDRVIRTLKEGGFRFGSLDEIQVD